MRVPKIFLNDAFHDDVNKFQKLEKEANTVVSDTDTALDAFREIPSKETRKAVLDAMSEKIKHLKKQRKQIKKFITDLTTEQRKRPKEKISIVINYLSSIYTWLEGIRDNYIHQRAVIKEQFTLDAVTSDKLDDLLFHQGDMEATITETSEKLAALISDLVKQIKPTVKFVGIAGLATSLTLCSLLTLTLIQNKKMDEIMSTPLVVSEQVQHEVTGVPVQEVINARSTLHPEFIIKDANPTQINGVFTNTYECHDMKPQFIEAFWKSFEQAENYEQITADNIRTDGTTYTITLALKKQPMVKIAKTVNDAVEIMLISKAEFDAVTTKIKAKYSQPVPFKYFTEKLTEEELIQECMQFSAIWEGGHIRNAYRDSKKYWTIGIGCLIDSSPGATTLKDIRWKIKTMGLAKSNSDCDRIYQELIEQKRTITLAQAEKVFILEISRAHKTAKSVFKNFDKLSPDLQIILVDFAFNMGATELKSWTTTPKLIQNGEILKLAKSLRSWQWYKDTNRRAWVTQSYLEEKYTLLELKKNQIAKN